MGIGGRRLPRCQSIRIGTLKSLVHDSHYGCIPCFAVADTAGGPGPSVAGELLAHSADEFDSAHDRRRIDRQAKQRR